MTLANGFERRSFWVPAPFWLVWNHCKDLIFYHYSTFFNIGKQLKKIWYYNKCNSKQMHKWFIMTSMFSRTSFHKLGLYLGKFNDPFYEGV